MLGHRAFTPPPFPEPRLRPTGLASPDHRALPPGPLLLASPSPVSGLSAGPLLCSSYSLRALGSSPESPPIPKGTSNCVYTCSLTPKLSHNLLHSMDSNPVLSTALAEKKRDNHSGSFSPTCNQEQMDSYFKTYLESNHCLARTAPPLTSLLPTACKWLFWPFCNTAAKTSI